MAGGLGGQDVRALGGYGERVAAVLRGERRARLAAAPVDEGDLGAGDGVAAGVEDPAAEAAEDLLRPLEGGVLLAAGAQLRLRSPGARAAGRGRSAGPTATAPVAIRKETRKPCMVGTATPPTWLAVLARTMPMTALDTDVPIERIRVLRPLAAPVSDAGTAPMISAGSEEYARPMPAPRTTAMTMVCQAALIRPRPAP